MDEERDLVVFEDDAGNELTMEVLDYLAYEGKEYALLTEYVEDDDDETQPSPDAKPTEASNQEADNQNLDTPSTTGKQE